jgi:hypothetical protein
MVKLTEVEDEHFTEKPPTTKDDALLASDDEDEYTDTGMNTLYPPNFRIHETGTHTAQPVYNAAPSVQLVRNTSNEHSLTLLIYPQTPISPFPQTQTSKPQSRFSTVSPLSSTLSHPPPAQRSPPPPPPSLRLPARH